MKLNEACSAKCTHPPNTPTSSGSQRLRALARVTERADTHTRTDSNTTTSTKPVALSHLPSASYSVSKVSDVDIVTPKVEKYCYTHTSTPSRARLDLERHTNQKHATGANMLSGALVGTLLQQLVIATRARRVLELGTFTGYSALTMAEAMPHDGVLISCELSNDMALEAQRNLGAHPAGRKVRVLAGRALDTLQLLHDTHEAAFDLVFIDADKQTLEQYYEFILTHNMLAPHGLMLVDNVLWKGRVTHTEQTRVSDARTELIHRFNERVQADPRVLVSLLSIRDGISVIAHRPQHMQP